VYSRATGAKGQQQQQQTADRSTLYRRANTLRKEEHTGDGRDRQAKA